MLATPTKMADSINMKMAFYIIHSPFFGTLRPFWTQPLESVF